MLLRLAPQDNESLCRRDQQSVRLVVRDGEVKVGERGAPGAPGGNGVDGKDGRNGVDSKDGKDGISGWERVVGPFSTDSEDVRTVTADCPAGKTVVGAGFETGSVSDPREVVVFNSFAADEDSWSVSARSDATNDDESFAIRAYALCVLAG